MNGGMIQVVLVDPVPALSSTFHMYLTELWSCFKCPISTPSHGLAEEVKVRFGVRFSCSVLGGNSLEVVFHFVGSDTPRRGCMVVISSIL